MIDSGVVGRIAAMMPFLEPATLSSRVVTDGRATDEYEDFALLRVRPRKVNKRDLALNPELLAVVEKVFELYATDLAAAASAPAPKKDDALTDRQGRAWVIVRVDAALSENVFNCLVRQQV